MFAAAVDLLFSISDSNRVSYTLDLFDREAVAKATVRLLGLLGGPLVLDLPQDLLLRGGHLRLGLALSAPLHKDGDEFLVWELDVPLPVNQPFAPVHPELKRLDNPRRQVRRLQRYRVIYVL